ncbi:MAG: NADH-quinone oxidoreductase subunit C [Syntrophomonas sp.]
MKFNSIQISPLDLLAAVKKYLDGGYRLVTITCVDEGEKVRLLYSFDRELSLENLELSLTREEAAPSISRISPCAFLVENEIKELFGIKMDDIALDLGGSLYMVQGAKEAPMSRSVQRAGKGAE